MTESDWERGYREGRAAGWDLGAIAAYEALPERLHHFDNPFAKRATGGIVRGAGSRTDDRVPFQFSGCQGTGYEVRPKVCGCGHPVKDHNADGCQEWWRYPDVLNPRQCGCSGVRSTRNG